MARPVKVAKRMVERLRREYLAAERELILAQRREGLQPPKRTARQVAKRDLAADRREAISPIYRPEVRS